MKLKEMEKKFAEREHAVEVIASRFKEKGPLSVLYRALHENKRIKIVTRNERGVRGCMECNISAFDKYFNFVAYDIEETYSVRVKKEKEYVNGRGETKTRRRRVIEQRERKVSQMFLRGECVVLVAMAEEEEEEEEEEEIDDGDEEAIAIIEHK
jgi:small nuclear ribonucleoprotein (snRNP)-like protein